MKKIKDFFAKLWLSVKYGMVEQRTGFVIGVSFGVFTTRIVDGNEFMAALAPAVVSAIMIWGIFKMVTRAMKLATKE